MKTINNSGIYMIKNQIDNKKYIGSSINLRTRLNKHKNDLLKNKHSNIKLQRAYNKHGGNNFIFEVIIYTLDKTHLIPVEQFYIDFLNPEYNILKIANSRLGMKHSDETKNKMRNKIVSEETKMKMRGKIRSPEYKKNLSLMKMGKPSPRKGIKSLPNTIEKMRKANLGKKYSPEINKKKGRSGEQNALYGTGKSIIQFDLNDNIIKEYISSHQVQLLTGFCASSIYKCCKNTIKTSHGYKWKFKEDYTVNNSN